MTKNINEEEQKEIFVKELGVFELRGVARQLGVSSPTTKKREELINLIMAASKNGVTIEEKHSKRGRPYKKLNILDSITNKIALDNSARLDFDSVVRFNQDVPEIDDVDDKTFFFEGITRKFNEDARLIDYKTNEVVYIPKNVPYFNKLNSGDKILVESKKLVGQEGSVALNIIEINSHPAQDYKHIHDDLGEEIIDTRTLPFGDSEVHLGRRNAHMLKENIYENDKFDKLYKSCMEKGIQVIALGVNTSFEDQIKFKNLGVSDNFTTVYGTDNSISFNKIVDVIVYANNLLMRGREILIFIPDIIEVLRCCDINFNNQQTDGQHSSKTIVIAQKLLSFAKAYSGNHSGTLVMCYNESDLNDKFLVNDILKISKKI